MCIYINEQKNTYQVEKKKKRKDNFFDWLRSLPKNDSPYFLVKSGGEL